MRMADGDGSAQASGKVRGETALLNFSSSGKVCTGGRGPEFYTIMDLCKAKIRVASELR